MSEVRSVLEDIRRGLLRNQQIMRKLKMESLELIALLCAKLEGNEGGVS